MLTVVGAGVGCNTLGLFGSGDGGGSSDMTDDSDGNTDTTDYSVFEDPESEFATSDVRDVDEETVRFDPAAGSLIWAADGTAFGGWVIDGNFLGSTGQFQVRFGTKDGERRAYFTETGPATICDIEVTDGDLQISPTSVMVPQE